MVHKRGTNTPKLNSLGPSDPLDMSGECHAACHGIGWVRHCDRRHCMGLCRSISPSSSSRPRVRWEGSSRVLEPASTGRHPCMYILCSDGIRERQPSGLLNPRGRQTSSTATSFAQRHLLASLAARRLPSSFSLIPSSSSYSSTLLLSLLPVILACSTIGTFRLGLP